MTLRPFRFGPGGVATARVSMMLVLAGCASGAPPDVRSIPEPDRAGRAGSEVPPAEEGADRRDDGPVDEASRDARIELIGGGMVAAGLFTRWAAFFSSGTMAVAYFMAHAPKGFWPIENRGELAILYCWAFLLISARGAGPWSLDAVLRRR